MKDGQTATERFLATLSEVCELHLYLATLVVQAVTAGAARWCLAVLGWTAFGLFVDLPFSPEFVGYVCALGPLVWSAWAFWQPGEGRLWHERVGAYDPSEGEAQAIDAAFEVLGRAATQRLSSLCIYVVDTNDKFAFVRGRTLIISRGLIESGLLAPVLAHELGHACSTDGRLIQALDRLVLWGDPLVSAREENTRREHGGMAALVVGVLRWAVRIAGGSLTVRLMSPLWARYWRTREKAADEYAVALGQGPALAQYLEDWVQPSDRPHPRLLFNLQEYERVAYRRDTLLAPPTRS
jgi:Zn-dependent protease with chaperone function